MLNLIFLSPNHKDIPLEQLIYEREIICLISGTNAIALETAPPELNIGFPRVRQLLAQIDYEMLNVIPNFCQV